MIHTKPGMRVQLNNDYHVKLEEGAIVFQAGAIGHVETPGAQWCRIKFRDDVSAIIPTRLLNEARELPPVEPGWHPDGSVCDC